MNETRTTETRRHRDTTTSKNTPAARPGAQELQEALSTRATPDAGNDGLTAAIIGCAIEVHRQLGPGLLESTYETALCIELRNAGLPHRRQVTIPALYKGEQVGLHRVDLMVADTVIVEVKSVERLEPVFAAQLLTYLRLTGLRVGLLINFNREVLRAGIKRVVL